VRVAPDARERIEALVSAYVDDATTVEVHGEAYHRLVGEIDTIGAREIAATAEMSDRLVRTPFRAMTGLLQGKSSLTRTLVELRHVVEELDPARYDLRAPASKALGVIPVGSGMRRYLDRYAKAQARIGDLIEALDASRAALQQDSAVIRQEQQALGTEVETLRQYAYMAERLDESVEARIVSIETTDGDRARALREDVLFPVRQRRQDILIQLAVATQGYAALRVVQANNEGLIRAVHTATTTTVAALRTAVTVARSMADQQLVAQQVREVDEVTRAMTEDASAPGDRPGDDLVALQQAWGEVLSALDSIDEHRTDALRAMKLTVEELSGQVERTRASLDQLDQDEKRRRS
jgi:uncharacterized protein YaaN involved in tellurite resistance